MKQTRDQIAARLAAAQHGLLSDAQAKQIGFTPGQIRHRLDHDRWDRVHRRVLGFPGTPASFDRSVMAAWLDVQREKGPVFARSTAARLRGLEGLRVPTMVEMVVERGRSERHPSIDLHGTRSLPHVDVETIRRHVPKREARALRRYGLVTTYRCTTASRTIIDLAPSVTGVELGTLIDSACRLGCSSPGYLARRLLELRSRGRAGVGRVEMALVDSGGHSFLERTLLTALRTAGLPKPRCQVVHRRDGKRIGRVDFDFDPLPLVVEVNGARGHSSDADRDKDDQRRNELQLIGVVVLEFSYVRVTADTAGVVEDIAAALGLTVPTAESAPRSADPAVRANGQLPGQ